MEFRHNYSLNYQVFLVWLSVSVCYILPVWHLLKVSTPLRGEPLDSMLNVIHGIGYSSSYTAWIIDCTLASYT